MALAGQPNVGKSAVFNVLTGLNQHVGNWPGKTIEQKTGEFTFEGKTIRLVDLPGTYKSDRQLGGRAHCLFASAPHAADRGPKRDP